MWADISIPAHDALIYSIVYNASYMVPETIITVIGAIFVGQMLDFRRETIERVPATARKGSNLLGGLCLAAAVAFDALMLYNAVQTEEGFDITLIGGANWLLMAAVSLCAVVLYFVPQAARPWTLGGFALAYDVVHVIQHGTAGADWAMLAGLTAGSGGAGAGFRRAAEICGGGRGGFLRWDPYRFHRSYRGAARFCLARRGMVYRAGDGGGAGRAGHSGAEQIRQDPRAAAGSET